MKAEALRNRSIDEAVQFANKAAERAEKKQKEVLSTVKKKLKSENTAARLNLLAAAAARPMRRAQSAARVLKNLRLVESVVLKRNAEDKTDEFIHDQEIRCHYAALRTSLQHSYLRTRYRSFGPAALLKVNKQLDAIKSEIDKHYEMFSAGGTDAGGSPEGGMAMMTTMAVSRDRVTRK